MITKRGLNKFFIIFLNFLLILQISASGSFWRPEKVSAQTYLIYTLEDLNNIRNDLDGDYQLMNDIDASETATWNGGAGWEPIGTNENPFAGSFDGNGKMISHLYINRDNSYIGFFGYSDNGAEIKNVKIENINIETGGGYTAGLVGFNSGTITN